MSLIEKAAEKLDPSGARSGTIPDLSPTGVPPAQDVPPLPSEKPAQAFQVDMDRLREMHIITPHVQYSSTAEEFRVIKRPLLNSAFNPELRHGNLIMVTSSLPGEGKSYCTLNLAMSISMEIDRTVLLVDADVSKPSVLSYLGIPSEEKRKGLQDLLQDDTLSPADVIMRTSIRNLSILPPGQKGKYSTELLASEAMEKLLDHLSQRYPDRIILFDSPPLLATTESRVLASHMGQIVLVVEAGKTHQAAVAASLSMMKTFNVAGVVLNKSRQLISADVYGYGYSGYGYGYGQA